MANTLTNLIPDAYVALDVVSREMVGFIPSVMRDPSADRVAVGQNLRIPAAPSNTAGGDITPAMAFPSAAYQTIGYSTLTLTKQRFYPFSWQNEERYAVNQGPGSLTINQGQIAQAMRGLVNEIEADIAAACALGASRGYGTAGTTPFGTNLGESAQVKKILDDNGAPGDRALVVDTTCGASLRTLLNNPLNANVNLSNKELTAQGVILDVNGFKFRESAQVTAATAGTGASYLINNGAGYAVGDTTLTLDTGSGTILAGDIITIGSHKYVVATALAAGSLTINAPGLRAAVADNTAVTVNATSRRNIGLARNACLLATRLPVSVEKDLAFAKETITDPVSGISFEIAAYPGIDMATYHVRAVWGVKVIKQEHIAVMLG